jgi:gliding motility-associated-like protein
MRDYDNGSGLNINEFGFYISASSWSNGPGTLHFARRVNSASYDVSSNSNTWQANVWYHVAGVIDPLTGMRLYINGVLQNSTDPSTQPIQPQTGSATDMVAVGTWGYWGFGSGNRYFNGDVDEIRFWTTARTQTEIRENMCRKINPSQAGLRAYYRFDNTSGTTLTDLTGNGYDGTTNGMSSSSWHYSSAPIGDTATNVYTASWSGQTLSLSNATGDAFTVSNVTTNPSGAHIYRVGSLPNSVAGLNNPLNDYYGVWLTNTSGSYDIAQDFSGYSIFCASGCQQLAARTHNAMMSWTNITPAYSACSYSKSNESSLGTPYRAEYILALANSTPPKVLGNDTMVCSSASYTLNANVSNATFSWNTGATSPSIVVTQSGTYWVDVTQNGCTLRDSVNITFSTPIAGITAVATPSVVCAGGTVTLNATVPGGGPHSYTWSPGNLHTNPAQANPQSTTVYTVLVSDGCTTGSATVTVNISGSAPTLTLSTPSSGCAPVCVSFSASPAASGIKNWLWNFGDGVSDTAQKPYHCYDAAGNYNVSLSYTSTTGCSKTISVNNEVSVFPFPHAAFTASSLQADILDPSITFYNQSTGAASWQWNFGDSYFFQSAINPTHTYLNNGDYTVTLVATSSHGCRDTSRIPVSIVDAFTFFAPNTFSPNGDGLNETFVPMGTGWDNSSFSLAIYDRWGKELFGSKNPAQGWDGRINKEKDPIQEDTFVWKVSLKDVFGKSHQYSGTVQLIQ